MPVPAHAVRRAARRSSRRCIAASPGPAATCRRRSLTNAELAQRIDTERRMGAHAHRHLPAPYRRAGRADQRSGAASRRSARWRRPSIAPADVDLIIVATTTPDMIFPSTACILQDKLGTTNGPAFDVQAVCSGFVYALAIADRDGGDRRRAETRWSSAPKSIRASSTGTIAAPACCSAMAPARSCSCRRTRRASCRAHLHADGQLSATSCRVPGTVANGAVSGTPLRANGWQRGVQVRGQGARRGRARSACRATACPQLRDRLADSASGEYPYHGSDDEEARPAARAHGHRRSACMPTRRRRRFRLALDVAVRDGRIRAGPARHAAGRRRRLHLGRLRDGLYSSAAASAARSDQR